MTQKWSQTSEKRLDCARSQLGSPHEPRIHHHFQEQRWYSTSRKSGNLLRCGVGCTRPRDLVSNTVCLCVSSLVSSNFRNLGFEYTLFAPSWMVWSLASSKVFSMRETAFSLNFSNDLLFFLCRESRGQNFSSLAVFFGRLPFFSVALFFSYLQKRPLSTSIIAIVVTLASFSPRTHYSWLFSEYTFNASFAPKFTSSFLAQNAILT